MKKIPRKEFIKVAVLGGVGLYLGACSSEDTKEVSSSNEGKDTAASKDVSPKPNLVSNNVTYYKKGDEKYEELRPGFNKRIQKYPLIIALCKNTEGVAEAIQYANENNLPVAIKSGGHCFEAFSSNNDGMVINMSEINKVELADDNTVTIGPGCKLSQLYDNLLPKKRIIPAGSCGGVGVGGLTLGGGYGLFSRDLGLTCDSLIEVTMVDGKGKIISSKNDPDLLWACRGGGNGNFGVITEMKFQTHQAPDTFTSHRFKAQKLDAARAASILEKWFEITKELPLSCFCAFVLNNKTLTILLTNYREHNPEVQKAIDALSLLTDKTTIGEPKPLASALKTYYGIQYPIYFKNASAGLYKSYEDIRISMEQVLPIVTSTPGMIYQVNTLGGNIAKEEFVNASAYPHREYPYLSELQTYWDEPHQEAKLLKAFQQVQDVFLNNNISTQYRNYPDINFNNWSESYYGENYSKLQSLKKKYDPENLIRHEQSVKE